MTTPENRTSRLISAYRGVLVMLLAGLILFLVWVALRLTIDYSDAYESFLNARALSIQQNIHYSFKRPILYTLFLSPWFVLERIAGLRNFAFVAGHIISVALYALTLTGVYRLARLFTPAAYSLTAVFLLAINPLVLHMAPFVKEDIPGMFLITFFFYSYIRTVKRRAFGWYLLCIFSAFGAMETRRYLIPVLPTIIVLHQLYLLISAESKSLTSGQKMVHFVTQCFFLIVIPIAAFFILPCIIYPAIGRADSMAHALSVFLGELKYHRQLVTEYFQPPSENLLFIQLSFSLSVCLLIITGLISSLIRRPPFLSVLYLWGIITLAYLSFAVGHKAGRYLFPVFPVLYVFAALGLHELVRIIPKIIKPGTPQRAAVGITLLTVLLWPVKNGLAEVLKFLDPVYSNHFEETVSRDAENLAQPDKNIIWFGTLYTIHPRDYVFHPDDEDSYIYHFFNHVLHFYLKKTVMAYHNARFEPLPGQSPGVWIGEQIGTIVANGDVLVVNPDPIMRSTINVPDPITPLLIQRVKIHEFRIQPESSLPHYFFSCSEIQKSIVETELAPEGYRIWGSNLPDGNYELYLNISGIEGPIFYNRLTVKGGTFESLQPKLYSRIPLESFFLLSYDLIRVYWPDKSRAPTA